METRRRHVEENGEAVERRDEEGEGEGAGEGAGEGEGEPTHDDDEDDEDVEDAPAAGEPADAQEGAQAPPKRRKKSRKQKKTKQKKKRKTSAATTPRAAPIVHDSELVEALEHHICHRQLLVVDAEPRGLCLAAIAEQAAALRNGPGCLSHDLLSQLVDAAEKLRLSLHSTVANYPRARDARQTVLRCAAVLEALDALLLRPTLLTLQLARDKEIVDALMQKVTAGEAARVAAHVVTLAVVVYGLAFDASRQVRHSAASGKTTAPGTKELQLPFFDGVQLIGGDSLFADDCFQRWLLASSCAVVCFTCSDTVQPGAQFGSMLLNQVREAVVFEARHLPVLAW